LTLLTARAQKSLALPGFLLASAYLLLLLPVVFCSPPWLERLLLAPPDEAPAAVPESLVRLAGLAAAVDFSADEDSEDLL
jgi:hypothetical protein